MAACSGLLYLLMPAHRIAARAARGDSAYPAATTDPDRLKSFLEDSAHFPGGHATAVAFPETEAEIAALLRRSAAILPIGAQSSLTGGATPMGEVVLSTSRLTGTG